MYRIKMEVFFDMGGTNAEVVDTVRDYEMRNLVEFDFLDLVFGEPMVREMTSPRYELLTEEGDVFKN